MEGILGIAKLIIGIAIVGVIISIASCTVIGIVGYKAGKKVHEEGLKNVATEVWEGQPPSEEAPDDKL